MSKRRKTGLEQFILDEAEVDDDAIEEEDYEGEDYDDLIDRDKRSEVEAAAAQIGQADISKHRRLQMMWENKNEREIEDYYKNKYAEQSARESAIHSYKDSDELNEEITQTAHLPTVKDPNLWMVKCQIGAEKTVALQLMRKFIAYENVTEDPGPLQIKSVIALDTVKGYVYIEAYKQTHLKLAIDGVNNLRLGLYKQTMVPISEMTDVLRVVKEQPKIKREQFVRLKKSMYKGDLAQVDYIDHAANSVTLRLKPRIDYTRMRGALKSANDRVEKRTKFRRPPPKLFDADAIRAIGGEVTTDGDFQIFEGNRYRRGLLYKNFPMDAIVVDGVKPTLGELESTEEQGLDKAELQLGADKETKFAPGDKVEVAEGELVHLQGKVISVDGSRVTMLPNHAELKDPLEFPASELTKCFHEGDHVKVIDGRYEGDTGTIVRTDDRNAILLSDLSMDEIKVLIRDLQLCPDRATGVDSLGHFNYGDLVQIDPQTVGVIVRLEKENLQILQQGGRVRGYKSQAVTKKGESTKKAVALDKDNNPIQVKDQVTVIEGPFKGKSATVKHIYRSFVFLHSKTVMENGGMFVCKSRLLQVVGSTGNRGVTTGFANPSMNPGFMSPRIASPHHPSANKNVDPAGTMMAPGAFGGRDRNSQALIGKTIKIIKGSYKGHIGIVKDAIQQNARVELHSDCRTITVSMRNIKPADGSSIPDPTGMMYQARSTPAYSAATPSHGSRTPMHMQTPLHDGSMTPMHTNQTPRADFDLDEPVSPKPTLNYATPATPNYQPPETPEAAGPYTPQTPGLYPANDFSAPYSPFGLGSNAPGRSSAASGYVAPSPGFQPPSAQGFGFTMTPGPASILSQQPQTPGTSVEASQEWQIPGLVVKIRPSRPDKGSLAGQTGYITNVTGNLTNVFLEQEDRTVSVPGTDLVPVHPHSGEQRFRVLSGEHRDKQGTIISIDKNEAVWKLDGENQVLFSKISELCLIQP
uniref:Transcription elongation factor SPT5 n=1 Tax=Aceria tosichella TaxID=561515 RepID=A0A6G1S9P1_9ACAR